MSPKECKERDAEIRAAASIPWLGFNHDGASRSVTMIQQYPLGRDYPAWTQRDLDELERGNLNGRNPDNVLAMIQSWMSLGLLESSFEVRFETRSFLSEEDANLVNTRKLRKWIDQYFEEVIKKNPGDGATRQKRRSRLTQSLEFAESWIRRLAEMERDHHRFQSHSALAASHLFGPVTRFIILVAEAVWAVAMLFPSDGERFFINCQWQINEMNERDLRQRCIASGWCPSIPDKMKQLLRTPTSFLEYLSIVSPFETGTSLHQRCSMGQCVQYNIDTNTYKPKHRLQCHGCDMVKPPIADIRDALRRGLIPVLSGSSLLDPGTVTVVEAISDFEPLNFVAFSHVWSDGLGSTAEAGLPTCQVEFLLDKTLRAGSTDLFWIDSLCIPADRETRKLAIASMARTYKSASATVILDSQIQRCNYERSLETRLLALSMSKWQERLWTLQESSLSKNLWCLFMDDRLVRIESLFSEEYNDKVYRPIVRSTGALLDNFSDWSTPSQVTLGAVQRNLYRRTSSKLDDEALAVAPFFPHVNMPSLISAEGQERMAELFKQVKHVPRDIVVAGPQKLSIDGFRWAPRSFMNQKDSTTLDLRDRSATVTEIRLKVHYWLCELSLRAASHLNDAELFYSTDKDWCIRVCSTVHYPDVTLSKSGHVVAFMAKPMPSAAPHVGIVLRKVTEGPFKYQPVRPVFRFVGLTGVDFMSQNVPVQHSAAFWAAIRQQAEERRCVLSEVPSEVYIR